ncbi:MAG: hypothetical protein GX457_11230 [Thermotogaceae bacterium]|nr:hypothetical protein [Thermotogaceae bacterium]
MDPSLEEQFLVPTLCVQVPRSWFKTEERAEMPDQVRHDGKEERTGSRSGTQDDGRFFSLFPLFILQRII